MEPLMSADDYFAMTRSAPDDQLAIVLGQRQLLAVCCMFLVVMGLVATLAYVSGRSITAAQMNNPDKGAAPPILVDPTKTIKSETKLIPPAPMQAHAAAAAVPVAPQKAPQAVERTDRPSAAASSEAVSPQPESAIAPGAYWQVGLVDRGVAHVFVEYLQRQGLQARLAPGNSTQSLRVLVGPFADKASLEAARKQLQAAGFQYFLRRY